jgi:putative Mn2+ efflux pump MntP
MSFLEVILLSSGLAMDAFAVSVSCGICDPKNRRENAIRAGVAFGVFQAGMLIIGWVLGFSFKQYIEPVDHWIAFTLLGFIGGKMIKESFEEESECVSLRSMRTLLTLAVATSIDAMAAGISLAALNIHITEPALMVGLITLITSAAGIVIGAKVHSPKLGHRMDFIGGVILIGIGLKILMEHLFFC